MASSRQHRHGFTIVQLIILLIMLALLVGSGVVIYATIHSSSSAPKNGGLTPITNSQTQTEQNAAQNQRRCAAMSPQQKEQLQQSGQAALCESQ